jgi:hypothetical protein
MTKAVTNIRLDANTGRWCVLVSTQEDICRTFSADGDPVSLVFVGAIPELQVYAVARREERGTTDGVARAPYHPACVAFPHYFADLDDGCFDTIVLIRSDERGNAQDVHLADICAALNLIPETQDAGRTFVRSSSPRRRIPLLSD